MVTMRNESRYRTVMMGMKLKLQWSKRNEIRTRKTKVKQFKTQLNNTFEADFDSPVAHRVNCGVLRVCGKPRHSCDVSYGILSRHEQRIDVFKPFEFRLVNSF